MDDNSGSYIKEYIDGTIPVMDRNSNLLNTGR
jgi:hypothetical protein